jgi:hypothetical protein
VNVTAKVIADSVASGTRLTTIEARVPKFLLAQLNTHRILSRNAASSRAIPTAKVLASVLADGYEPTRWGRNQPGMVATGELDVWRRMGAVATWRAARYAACAGAWTLAKLGVHKEHTNRLVEPFSWAAVVITSTDWANFLALRDHADAQLEMTLLARAIRRCLAESTPRELADGEWHLPYVTDAERTERSGSELARLSAVRAARVSYARQGASSTFSEEWDRATKLIESGHMSPLEHPAYVGDDDDECLRVPSNFRAPFIQLRKTIPNEAVFRPSP